MATRTSSILFPDNSTDANFRAWVQFIEDTLVTTGGWVVTGDTGQTSPGSLAHPTVANTKQGYRIYRMADSLQGTSPVFMRLDFGSAAAATVCGFWVTIGTGSDGAGNITGTVWNGGASATPNVANGASSSPSAANHCYGSADTNRVSLGMFIQGLSTYPFAFTLERTKDATGADTGTGLLLAYNGVSQQFNTSRFLVLAGGSQPTAESGLSYVLTRQNPSETFGSDIGCGILIHFKGVAQQPGTNVMVVNSSDVSAEGQFSLTLYGATRTYQHLSAGVVPSKALSASNTTDSNARVGIRYD